MHPSRTQSVLLLPLLLVLAATGCRVSSNKSNGNNDVKVATPFGALQIKTNAAAAQASVGLPTYPGAQFVENNESNSGAADINIGFGSFQMRVKAVSYRTPDSVDKVQAFYRNALHRYGDIIQCSNNHPVGQPDHTSEGLTCNDDQNRGHKFSVDADPSKLEFKAGSKRHQHIVSVEPDRAGAKFSLIALDLPGALTDGHDKTDSHAESQTESED